MHLPASIILAACISPAFAAEWQTDLETARQQAATENKPLLVAFTGKGWCGSCMDMERRLTHTPAFIEPAAKNFILVELDLPKDSSDTDALKVKNRQWATQCGISYIPALLVMDAEGGVYGGFFGGTPSDDNVRPKLDRALASLKENTAKRKQAEKQSGAEKTETLVQAYLSIEADQRPTHRKLREQIRTLDPEDASGLAELEKLEEQLRQPTGKTSDERTAWSTSILRQIETATSRRSLPPATRIPLLAVKLSILSMQARTPEQLDAAIALLDELIALSPENAAWYAQWKTDILRRKELMQGQQSRQIPGICI